MYKNYFFLNRLIIELNNELAGFKIIDIFTQEKDKLVLEFHKTETTKFVEICVNPGNPFINLRTNYNRAKKNTFGFYEDYLPAKLKLLSIAESDRIIKILLSTASIYFAVRGKFTNIYLIDNDKKIFPFENISEDDQSNFLREVSAIKFIDHFNIPNFASIQSKDSFDEIRKSFPILGKEIINEAKMRYINSSKDHSVLITGIVKEIERSNAAVLFDKLENKIAISFKAINPGNLIVLSEFDSILEALNYYFGKKYYQDNLIRKKRLIVKVLDREINRITNKLNNLKSYLDKGDREEEYKQAGNLILINLLKIPNSIKEIELENVFDGNKIIKIKLDDKVSAKHNAELYFKKAKNEKTAYKKSLELFSLAEKKFNRLKILKDYADNLEDLKGADEIMKELKIKDNQDHKIKDEVKSKFKHYLIDGKYNVYVGKDSQNNDLLTTKFAKQNDYWFHARSVPGSHVVLRVSNSKEQIPKPILKKSASLAAFHSKAKTAGLVPVSFTMKKYVVKKKGMEPGKVALLREDTLLVRPEIPTGCEYILED